MRKKPPALSWQLAAVCLPALLLAEVMPPLAADMRDQLSGEQPSVTAPTVGNALPVRSRIEPWQIIAERLNFQSWKWRADASTSPHLPALTLNSTATGSLAQGLQWASDASVFALPAPILVTEVSTVALPQDQWNTHAGGRISDVNSWGAQATGSLARALQWASDASSFALPSLTLKSTALPANYATAQMDLLRVRFDSLSNSSPLGVALQRVGKDPSAIASAESLAVLAEGRAKARKQNPKPREQKFK